MYGHTSMYDRSQKVLGTDYCQLLASLALHHYSSFSDDPFILEALTTNSHSCNEGDQHSFTVKSDGNT